MPLQNETTQLCAELFGTVLNKGETGVLAALFFRSLSLPQRLAVPKWTGPSALALGRVTAALGILSRSRVNPAYL